ncbi:zinc finger protein 462-like isoform X2 [Cottoperca gobio]|nr:zinc finger protein 462-like isoform X2 [Cottoperca gobio]
MCEAVFGEECKMQQDSINFSSSGHMTENQVIPQESTIKSFQCCHCPLLFKSKVYLFEHLNTVHGFDVDAALKEAGLKYPGNNKANTDNNCTRSGDDFQCQHCDFIACSWDVLNDHDKQCHKKLEDQNVIGNLNPGAKITVISTNQHSGAAGAKETTPSFSVMSTSNSKYAIVSSKDLKTYKRPLQTITKYFVATSGPNVKPAVKLADSSELPDSTKGTIILQESPSSSSPNSSGVFKVTAKSLIDITHVSQRFLLDDHLLNTDLRPPKPKEQSKETVPSNAGKRTNNESSKSPPAKKAKSDNETKPPEEASASKQQPSSNTEISFDFSEDEGEKKLPFTTDVLKALKKHYKKNHLIHAVDNSLMYCRYSATGCHEGSSQSNKCEKALGPERRGGISPESACSSNKEVKNPPSPQHPISPGADVGFYHCNTCKFSHKSVVVMHVHYQKSHPGKEVTMDKIKSAHVTSHRTSQKIPDKTPNPVAITGTSAHQMNISDTFKKTKDKAELSQRKHAAEDSKTHSESPKTMKAESAEDGNKGKRSPSKRMRERESLTRISPIKLFYCQFCSYSSTNIKSVVGHHNAKHAVHALTCIEEILSYSAEVQKNKLQSEAEASPSTKSSNTKTNKQVKVYSEKVQHEEENVYACAENLFYCQKCNYGNPSVKGVANHHCKIHRSLHYSRERTLEHTALIRDEIEKSKSQAKDFPFSTRLPLPLINEGDEDMFFCHFCNYRQCTKEYVLRHYVKRHRGFMVTGEQVCLYTSVVREKTQKSHLKTTANQEVDHFKVKENKKAEKLGKSVSVSAAPSVTPSQTQRTLQCYRCAYSTQYVCVLKRHIWKVHRANRTVSNVLRKCYKQGSLQTGYHCDMCVFSHKDAAVVYEHYHEQHPGRKPSLDYVTNQLYVGPKLPKRKKPQINHSDDTDGRSPSQKPGQNESKTYSCRACSFKGSSLSILARHYRDVHPWSVKEDGSVLGVVKNKRPSASRLVEDHNKLSGSFETYQVPLEFDDSPGLSPEETASSEMLTCPNCPSKFYTQHGLNTHCGMKHHEAVNENAEEPQEQIQTRMYVFKCPHCSYVNTNYQGVLTHCQMMHPALESRADNFHLDEAHLSNWDDCLKRKGPGNPGNLKISGYMCLDCPHICSTLEKLKKHCEKEHTETPTPSAVSKLKQYRTLSNRLPVSQVSFLSKKVYAVVRCQFCAYCCSTKLALGRHMLVHHRKAPAAKVQESVFKCILCSNSYFTKKRLRSHYFNKHGRDSFLEYFAPVYKKADEKPEPTSHDPLTQATRKHW